MKRRTKILSILLVLMLSLVSVTACGGVKGETLDVGDFTVLVPDGWQEFVFAQDSVQILKDCKDGDDTTDKVGIAITYASPESTLFTSRDFFDDTKDIDPAELEGLSDFTWTGFTGNSGMDVEVLEGEKDGHQLQVTIFAKNTQGDTLSFRDDDVKAVIQSITIK